MVLCLVGSIAFTIYGNRWPFFNLLIVVPTSLAGASAFCFMRCARRSDGRSPSAFRANLESGANRGGPSTQVSASSSEKRCMRFLPEAFVVLALVGCLLLPVTEIIALMFCTFLATILSLAFLGDACTWPWRMRFSVFLGEISYSLYMTHTIAQRVLTRCLPSQQFESADTLLKVGVLLAYAAVVALACAATYFLVERPCRRRVQLWAAARPISLRETS